MIGKLNDITIIIDCTQIQMNKQPQYTGDMLDKQIQSKYHQDQVDPKRIKRIQIMVENYQVKDNKNEQNTKAPIKFHKFREQTKKFHRELIQQNHDLLKITNNLTKSVLNNNRFDMNDASKNNKNKITNQSNLNDRDSAEKPNIILDYKIELNTALIEQKINTKQVLSLSPFKTLSIELQPNIYIKPDFDFFFFRNDNSKALQIENKLVEVVDEGLASDIKQQIITLTYYLNYFDYIDICKVLFSKPKVVQQKYPKQVMQLAKNSLILDSSDVEQFNKKSLDIQGQKSYHRVFECDQSQLAKPFDSIYFPDIDDFQNYKRLRAIEYKKMKIEAQDIFINTDVRNIISSEKIYLINIIQQMKLSVDLLKTNKQDYLLKTLHEMTVKKMYQYLHLVCGYTNSKILIRYNIADPYSKIYEFLYKSIKYGKPYQRLDRQVIERYPVLEIWYNMPEKIFGFSIQEIHQTMYNLIKATIQFEKVMQEIEKYEKLKIKQYDRKYLADNIPKNEKQKNINSKRKI